ncbi:hypothetical protein [Streptomyces sp. NBC_00582]|uniref:hypothetical protein n=1 Tax=Streptomyces sp. NBC_00582 TaxID=2975783 RepID=UPI0010F04356|nr:hypothetical protein [Streptomyces sp. NBC_00582]WUB63108.1 hypothetical protein OG852_23215 [Streptomyces sp. NBC_00582]
MEPTAEGRTTFPRAATVHAGVVEAYFVEPLTPADHTRLTGALGEIDRTLRADGARAGVPTGVRLGHGR